MARAPGGEGFWILDLFLGFEISDLRFEVFYYRRTAPKSKACKGFHCATGARACGPRPCSEKRPPFQGQSDSETVKIREELAFTRFANGGTMRLLGGTYQV
jgi:hypothetical protein